MSLSKLIEAVEAGAARPGDYGHPDVMFMEVWLPTVSGPQLWQYASEAYDGSLDAAKRLHDALLPGWQWLVRSSDDQDVLSGRCQHGQFLANIWREGSPNEGAEHFPTWVDDPARAWLLSILRALEQEGR